MQPPGSRQSPATTSDRPGVGASNAGSGTRPSMSRQQPLQSSLDSARHGGSWQSLQSVRTDPSDGADAVTPQRSDRERIADAVHQTSRLSLEQQQQAGQAQPRELKQVQPAELEQDSAAGSGAGPPGEHLANFVGSLMLSCCRFGQTKTQLPCLLKAARQQWCAPQPSACRCIPAQRPGPSHAVPAQQPQQGPQPGVGWQRRP